ncbi:MULTISPECIES: UPF0262 family protein [Iodidimonas]|jgi:uncharacterized protein (UPF0262 family)|uniref:UPF0262 protein JCM17846_18150 n=1 Tax=Iodidimonas nitroreducens TaxID=1236968 RepID=A0A5A7N724_9PROT|nr:MULTISPECIES: UPF0262 family protein [Iodidimonas]GAK33282.1 hypothetical protein AQ1_01170 [alpha proteobacterium Q-1]GER04133.1 UPF0262 protein [Iodidimonas nitroreducens]
MKNEDGMGFEDGDPLCRLIDVALDEASIVRWNADIDHERRVAIFDLLQQNYFDPVLPMPGGYEGPYRLLLRLEEGRLLFELSDQDDHFLEAFRLPLTPFRRVIKDYFAVCDSYFQAIKTASPGQIEAIDMGRRGLHNDGSALLAERLKDKVLVDQNTARRLFTLICVLHIRG